MPSRPDASHPKALVIEDPVPPPKIIIMGGPGCGKGTLCRAIVDRFGVEHISVGDVLRDHMQKQTDLGIQVKEYIQSGRLVPDELAIEIVKEYVSRKEVEEKGWMLDNFPRTGDQAEAMMELKIFPEKYILIEVPDVTLVERCMGRLTDPETGAIYHEKFRPPPDDEEIKARLIVRDDDNEEAVHRRLEAYHENMEGVLDHLEDIKKEFDGEQPVEQLVTEICTYIKPDAPLYARKSTRPPLVTAEDVKAKFKARQAENGRAEGEEVQEEEAEAEAKKPKGDDWRKEMALEIIDECLSKPFDREQEQCRVNRLTYQFASQHAIGTLDMLINVHFIEHDKGDRAHEPSWDAGEEPVPASMDSWGRGSVPLKRKLKPLTMDALGMADAKGGSRPGSASSRGSRRSGRSIRAGAPAQDPSKLPGKKGAAKPKKEEEKKKVSDEVTPEDKLRAMLKAKQDAELAKSRKAKEYMAEVEKMEKMVKSMASRGQNFTMDHKGEILLVNELPGDKIPAPHVPVKSALNPPGPPPEDPRFHQQDVSTASLRPANFFTPSDTVQPPAAESHILASGVTLKEGSTIKSGPPRERSSLHMTKKEYSSLIEDDGSMPGLSLRRLSQDGDEKDLAASAPAEMTQAPKETAAPKAVAAQDPSQAGASLDHAPALDAGVAGLPVAAGGAKAQIETSVNVFDWEKNDFFLKDAAIVSDPLAKQKVDDKAKTKSIGIRPKGPRDRFIIPEVVQPKDYLPPPIYPGTYGHGVVTSYLANENQFVRDPTMWEKRALDGSLSSPKNTLSPIKSLKSEKSDESVSQKIMLEYPRNFTKGPAPTVTTVNANLLRELRVDQQAN